MKYFHSESQILECAREDNNKSEIEAKNDKLVSDHPENALSVYQKRRQRNNEAAR